MKNPKISRNHKDRLFRAVFGSEQNRSASLALYNAINGTDYCYEDELEITTIDDFLYMGMKNDLSFLFQSKINLYEHQSSFNPNMPVRGLMYFSNLYETYIQKNDLNIYGRKLCTLPYPQYIIFYNGKESRPETETLLLSDAFGTLPGKDLPALEVRAHVVNINAGYNEKLKARCRLLNDYSFFIDQIRRYTDTGADIQSAVDRSIKDLKDGQLYEFLLNHRLEVADMLFTEYNEDEIQTLFYKDGFKDGQSEGRSEGADMLGRLIEKLTADGRTKDIYRAATDKNFRAQAFAEYEIE